MPCYNPVQIINPTHYINTRYKDRFVIQGKCGKCAGCMKMKSNEWYYRTYWQAQEVFGNGFVQFDTLTYRDEDLPHMSDYLDLFLDNDYPCFNSHHLRQFVTSLRQVLKRKYNSNFTYFISSEYGTTDEYNKNGRRRKATHRPHYHILSFVQGDITPLQFSALVAQYWKYGRTDGYPYKTAYYVNKNTFTSFVPDIYNTFNYVAKYVQKSFKFQKDVNKRIYSVMKQLDEKMGEVWSQSLNRDLTKEKITRQCNQFHRQSTQFGSFALQFIDIQQLENLGTLYVPDSKKVNLAIGLPTYYKRKLFYKTIKVDGNMIWIPTDEGKHYLKARDRANLNEIQKLLHGAALSCGKVYDIERLARYVYYDRGRLKGELEPDVEAKLKDVQYYSYITRYDKHHLGARGITTKFIGNNTIGYRQNDMPAHYKIPQFIAKYVFFDDEREKELACLNHYLSNINQHRQSAEELKQRLTNLYKWLRQPA